MKIQNVFPVAFLATMLLALGGCAGSVIRADPPALHGDYSGKGFSGAFAMIPDDCDIPGVPASNCKMSKARWAPIDAEQVLHIDAHCQTKLFESLPGWAQAIATESSLGALATAVGEAGFAAAFPGADAVRYFLAGLGYGLPSWANNGRIRQDQNEKGSQGYCATLKIFRAQQRYKILNGWDAVPWAGDGRTVLPPVTDKNTDPELPYVEGGGAALPMISR